MTTYKTMNPLGSTAVKDLYDNAENLDDAVNGAAQNWIDRFGRSRRSLQGFEDSATAVLAGLGYLPPVPYGAGLDMQTANQTVSYGGETYAPIQADLPFTTSGTFEVDKFRLIQGVSGADLIAPTGAEMVGFKQVDSAKIQTVDAKLKQSSRTPIDFPSYSPGGGDNTQAVIDAAASFGLLNRGVVRIPYGVKFNKTAVQTSPDVPVGVVFQDESVVNGGYLGAGIVGTFDKGDPTRVTDFTTTFGSGHNAAIALDNSGNSGSTSGQGKAAGIYWFGGTTAKGLDPGLARSIGALQWGLSGDRWNLTLRKRAPAPSMAHALPNHGYFLWAQGTVVEQVGEFCFHNPRYYKATSTGVCGATPPTHTSGAVSDGGVTWEAYQFSYDQSTFSVDDLGHISTNGGTTDIFAAFRQSVDDDAPYVVTFESRGESEQVRLRLIPTDASGSSVAAPEINATSGEGLRFLSAPGSVPIFQIANEGVTHRALYVQSSTAPNGSTTPSVANIGRLILNNSSPTILTGLTSPLPVIGQTVQIIDVNGNSTLQQGAGFALTGGVDAVLTANSVITLTRISTSSRWVEVSRSLK